MSTAEIWSTGFMLIGIIFAIIGIPCACVAWIGYKLIKDLSYYPSKTPAIQMSILFKLITIELFAVTLLMLFYHAMATYG